MVTPAHEKAVKDRPKKEGSTGKKERTKDRGVQSEYPKSRKLSNGESTKAASKSRFRKTQIRGAGGTFQRHAIVSFR